jgi:hypothetical protein
MKLDTQSVRRHSIMLSYIRQVAVCESVRETIKQAIARSDEVSLRQKAHDIPSADGILREVSLSPDIHNNEGLRDVIIANILSSLHLTASQRGNVKT